MKIKILHVVLVFIAVLSCIPFSGYQVSAVQKDLSYQPQGQGSYTWYNASWNYRKSIVIDQTDDLGVDVSYQIKLLVGKTSSATGEDVDLNGHCQDDFDDLRFTKSDSATLLDYWIESISGSGDTLLATVWIEAVLLDDAADTTIYMYYGNSGASAASNGANTFLLFDDFSGTTLNSTNWNSWVNQGSGSIGSSLINFNSSSTSYILSKSSISKPYSIRAKATASSGSNGAFIGGFSTSSFTNYYYYGFDTSWSAEHAIGRYDGSGALGTSATTWATGTVELSLNSSVQKAYNNENLRVSTTDATYSTNPSYIYIGADASHTASYDWVLVRKWTTNEPTWSSFGSEESATPTVTTQDASSVEETTATGNGNITNLNGGANCTIRGFEYDTDSGAPYANSAYDSGSYGTGAYTKAITGLTKGELYYMRAYATNPVGTGYGSEVTFLTKPDEPTGFTATPGDGKVDLSWTNGTGSDKVMIRYRTDGSYPTGVTDGTQAYFDTGTSYEHTGLTNGNTYKYRGWGYVTEGGLTQYSDLYIEASATPAAFAAPTMITGQCTGFTSTQSVLNGTMSNEGSAPVSVYGFDYGLTTGYGSSSTITASISNGASYWSAINGLLPASVYHYRAKAYNGAWGYGSDATFSTVGSPVLYESLTTGYDGDSDNITGNTWGYQQFTATSTHTVTGIQVYIKRVGNPGTVTIALYHGSGGTPTGTVLESTTFNGDAISTSYEMYKFNIDATPIQSGNQYAIVIAASNGTESNYIKWGVDSGGGLANAEHGKSTNGGLTWTSAAPKDALFAVWGDPAIKINGANVFTGYKQAGDWLIVADTENFYVPYYDTYDPAVLFQVQLINGTNVVATAPCKAWQRQPVGIYINASSASLLTWADSSYLVRISLLSDSSIYSEYALTGSDWKAGGNTYLQSYILNLAAVYEKYYTELKDASVIYLTSTTSGKVLNSDGSTVFSTGIPYLMNEVPGLFAVALKNLNPGTGTPVSTAIQDDIEISDRLGPQIYGIVAGISDGAGMTPKEFVSMLCWGLMVLCAVLCGAGAFAGGLISGSGFLAIGLVFGAIDWVMIIAAVFLAVIVIALRVFINNQG